jgi:hypothetical protein
VPTRTSDIKLVADEVSADFLQIFVTPPGFHPVKEMKGDSRPQFFDSPVVFNAPRHGVQCSQGQTTTTKISNLYE